MTRSVVRVHIAPPKVFECPYNKLMAKQKAATTRRKQSLYAPSPLTAIATAHISSPVARHLHHHWKRWPYKNTTLLVLSLVLVVLLIRIESITALINRSGEFGYLGAFISGIFFTSTFTAAPAGVVLYNIADHLHPFEVAIIAGLGSMLGDYILFRLIEDSIFAELHPVIKHLKKRYFRTLFKTPYFAWLLPVIGALVIASPFPDEIGISMLGLSRMSKWQFFAVTFLLNSLGILMVVTIARL